MGKSHYIDPSMYFFPIGIIINELGFSFMDYQESNFLSNLLYFYIIVHWGHRHEVYHKMPMRLTKL